MRNNQPVTNVETFLDDSMVLLSKTDLKGIITYVNDDFIRISGFSEEELIGKPHNIVRHPDIPSAIFKDLWDTIKRGEPWSHPIKNRRKDGGFYWVVATATPSFDDQGKITGYISVRKKVTEKQKEEATKLIQKIHSGGKLKSIGFSPASWIANLKIYSRLLLLTFVLLLPIGFFIYLTVDKYIEDYQFYVKEEKGIVTLLQLNQLIQSFALHRGLTSAYLSGDQSFGDKIFENEKEITEAIKKFDLLEKNFSKDQLVDDKWKIIRQDWGNLQNEYKSLSVSESLDKHTELIAKALSLNKQIGDSSNLILDSFSEIYYLVSASINFLPYHAEAMGQLRARGLVVFVNKKIDPNELKKIIELRNEVDFSFKGLVDTLQSIHKPEVYREIAGKLTGAIDANHEFLNLVKTKLIEPGKIEYSQLKYMEDTTKIINANHEFQNSINSILSKHISIRMEKLNRRLLFLAIGSSVLFVFAIVFVILVIRSIRLIIGDSTNKIKTIARGTGNLNVSLYGKSNDEMNLLLKWMNVVILNFAEVLFLIRKESVFLMHESEKTSELIKKSNDSLQSQAASTEETAAAVEELSASFDAVFASISNESNELKEISNTLVSFNHSINRMDEAIRTLNAQTSSFAVKAKEASAVTEQTIEAIDTVDENARKIDEVVSVINEISDRTNLLALNAAIEAARAGEHGRGFAVVADEISKLAVQTSVNTKNISTLISNTQKSIQSAVERVNHTSSTLFEFIKGIQEVNTATELVSKSQLEQKSGSEMITNSVRSISENSAGIVDATRQQKIATEEIAKTIQTITMETQSIAYGIENLMETASTLEETGKSFNKMLSNYKV